MLVSTSSGTALRVFASLELPGTVHLGLSGQPVRRLATGIPELDAALDGGLPRGRLSEITGAVTAGKTSVLLAFLAAATQRGEATALIDLPDALHPAMAQVAGVELSRLLWVRPPSLPDGLRCAELILAAGGFGFVAVDLGSPHPRHLRTMFWHRLARAVEPAGAAAVIVTSRRMVGSFAALSLEVIAHHRLWSRGAWRLFEGLQMQLGVTSNKLGTPGRRVAIRAGVSCLNKGLPLLSRARPTSTLHDRQTEPA